MLARHWWFWLVVVVLLAGAAVSSRRYRRFVASARALAVRRGLVSLQPTEVLDAGRGLPLEFSWLVLLLGAWTVVAPWTWGYDGANGAIATDAVTGGAVIGLALCGIVFPAASAVNLLAGLWLVIAPWIVGYGDTHGGVGVNDSLSGALVFALSIATLVEAERSIRRGQRAIGRIQVRK